MGWVGVGWGKHTTDYIAKNTLEGFGSNVLNLKRHSHPNPARIRQMWVFFRSFLSTSVRILSIEQEEEG